MTEHLRQAVAALSRGEFVVVVDGSDRENEADLVIAAEAISTEKMAFLLRHTSGIVCVPMPAGRADRLDLALMVEDNTEPHQTAFTVSVDALGLTSTGVSAAERAATARLLADPAARPADFCRPGHIFPLRARNGGVRARPGHTEAAVDLGRLAGVTPVMVISELTRDDGSMARGTDAAEFAARHGIPLLTVAELVESRLDDQIEKVTTIPLPTDRGDFDATLLRSKSDGLEFVVLAHGDLTTGRPLVRIHSECATGDLFGSRRCDCGEQLTASLDAIAAAKAGVLIYVRGHEGRGIGLADKFRAYALQDKGTDTVDANLRLGHPADARDFGSAARILRSFGVHDVELLTNNPDKVNALRRSGLTVRARPLRTEPFAGNIRYLRTKQARLHHDLGLTEPEPARPEAR